MIISGFCCISIQNRTLSLVNGTMSLLWLWYEWPDQKSRLSNFDCLFTSLTMNLTPALLYYWLLSDPRVNLYRCFEPLAFNIAFCYFHCSLDSIWDQGLSCPIVHISLMYNFWKLLSYFLFCFPWIKKMDVTLSLPAVHNSLPFLLAKGGNDPKSLHSLQRTLLLSLLTNAVLHIREIIEIIFQNLNVIDEC